MATYAFRQYGKTFATGTFNGLELEFKKEVETAAKTDNKTLSGYITDCLLLDLKKRRKKNGKHDD